MQNVNQIRDGKIYLNIIGKKGKLSIVDNEKKPSYCIGCQKHFHPDNIRPKSLGDVVIYLCKDCYQEQHLKEALTRI